MYCRSIMREYILLRIKCRATWGSNIKARPGVTAAGMSLSSINPLGVGGIPQMA